MELEGTYDKTIPYAERIQMWLNCPALNTNPLFVSIKASLKHFYSTKEHLDRASYKTLLHNSAVNMAR